jgi:D-xylulose reductase
MKAVVLEEIGKITIRDDIAFEQPLGVNDVRIAIKHVGICGSDVHYYENGRIGPYIVKEPMILGHEASGVVTEVGSQVTGLAVGDAVCMEPGIPDPNSRASRLGLYNIDPAVTFWATPPIHGCLCESVVHPAAYTHKLPPGVSLKEGAMVEPLAIGVYSAAQAHISPGDVALVLGAGTIGIMTALAARASGCSMVIVADVVTPKLSLLAPLEGIVTVNLSVDDLAQTVERVTSGWGCDVVFEASGSPKAFASIFDHVCPGGKVVLIGIPKDPAPFDVAAAQAKEALVIPIFRYRNIFPKAVALMASGSIDVKPFISQSYPFDHAVEAFKKAASHQSDIVKIQIDL